MNYIVDSDLLIDINKGMSKILLEISKRVAAEGMLYITLFNFIEYYFGELGRGKEEQALAFLDGFKQLSLTKKSAKLYSELSRKYEKAGKSVSAFDLLIAAIAIDTNMTVLTRDAGFQKIEELKKHVLEA